MFDNDFENSPQISSNFKNEIDFRTLDLSEPDLTKPKGFSRRSANSPSKKKKTQNSTQTIKDPNPSDYPKNSENFENFNNFKEFQILNNNFAFSPFSFCYKTELFTPTLFLNHEASTLINGFDGLQKLSERFYNMDLDDVEVESLEFEDFEKIQSFSQNALKGFFMEQNKNRGEVMDEYQKNKMLLKTKENGEEKEQAFIRKIENLEHRLEDLKSKIIDIREKSKKVGVFKCPICSSKMFKTKDFLESHMQRRHSSTMDPTTAVLINEELLEKAEQLNNFKKKSRKIIKEEIPIAFNKDDIDDIDPQKSNKSKINNNGSSSNINDNQDFQKIIEKLENLESLKKKELEGKESKNNKSFEPAIIPQIVQASNFNLENFEEKLREIINGEIEKLGNGMKKNLDEKVTMIMEQNQKEREDLVKSAISSDFRPHESAMTEKHNSSPDKPGIIYSSALKNRDVKLITRTMKQVSAQNKSYSSLMKSLQHLEKSFTSIKPQERTFDLSYSQSKVVDEIEKEGTRRGGHVGEVESDEDSQYNYNTIEEVNESERNGVAKSLEIKEKSQNLVATPQIIESFQQNIENVNPNISKKLDFKKEEEKIDNGSNLHQKTINESQNNYSNILRSLEDQEKKLEELVNNKYALNNSSIGVEEMMNITQKINEYLAPHGFGIEDLSGLNMSDLEKMKDMFKENSSVIKANQENQEEFENWEEKIYD